MPLERLDDPRNFWTRTCRHPEHCPPSHSQLEPGHYAHTCPGCGFVTHFMVPAVRFDRYTGLLNKETGNDL